MKHTYRILLTVIAILMLHSCGLYRKYEREDLHFARFLLSGSRKAIPNFGKKGISDWRVIS